MPRPYRIVEGQRGGDHLGVRHRAGLWITWLTRALTFTINGGKVSRIEVIADPDRLARLDLAVLG